MHAEISIKGACSVKRNFTIFEQNEATIIPLFIYVQNKLKPSGERNLPNLKSRTTYGMF